MINNDPNSNEYLEMANHAKSLVEKAEEDLKSYKVQNLALKKLLLTCYGVVRLIDEMNQGDDIPGELSMTLELLRGYLSDNVEDFIK